MTSVHAIESALRGAGCVFAEDEARVLLEAAKSPQDLEHLLARRVAGEPLEHIVGWAEFAGRRVHVVAGVFVPRRRTEFLATCAIRSAKSGRPVVVELCCGVAAVAAAIDAALPGSSVHAADVDEVAASCAQMNVPEGNVYVGDLYDALPATLQGHVDVLVANAPYVPTDAIAFMPSEAREREPRVALDGGADGLDVHRRIAADAGHWLAPGGVLLIEVSPEQVPTANAFFAASGLNVEVAQSDDLDATVIIGSRRP